MLYILEKIDFDRYLESTYDEKFTFLKRILIDVFEDSTSVRIKNLVTVLDGFVKFFDNFKSRLSG